MNEIDLKNLFILQAKKRQFYNHDTTLRYNNPIFQHHRLFSVRVSLPHRVGTIKAKLELKRKKLKELIITDCSKLNSTPESQRNNQLKLGFHRRKLQPLGQSINASIEAPELQRFTFSPYSDQNKIDAVTST